MAEETKINQNSQNAQKDFTKKLKYERKVDKTEKTEKTEKADLNFNKSSGSKGDSEKSLVVDSETISVESNSSTSSVVSVVIPESKPVTVTESSSSKTVKVHGKVVCVSPYSYVVKTKDGKGILVMGNHDKKFGDII